MGYMLNSAGTCRLTTKSVFTCLRSTGSGRNRSTDDRTELRSNCSQHRQSAVIAKGLNPVEWYGEVAEKYLGKDFGDHF